MAKQTTRIKINPLIKESLDVLKTDENWTYSLVIDALIVEHDEHAIVMAEKEKKIREECVEKVLYDKLYNGYIAGTEKVKELEDRVRDLNDREKEFAVELKKQHDAYVESQGVLTAREEELKGAYGENEGLREDLDELKAKQDVYLSGIQKQYDALNARYNNLRDYVDRACVRVDVIKTLYRIAWFLHRHKHSFFTIEQLTDKIAYNTQDEIAEAMILSKYKVFPIRRYMVKDVGCYGFDRRYLK